MGRFTLVFLLLSGFVLFSVCLADRKSYIIHMDKSAMPAIFSSHHDWFISTLVSLPSVAGVSPIHLYTYKHVMHGFSAVLSQDHLDHLESLPGHVATFPESFGRAQTTHTPKFLGLNRHSGLWKSGSFGDDMIIGVLDTGIWPESESFSDRGMPPVPKRWRGTCEAGTKFNSSNCNRKVIGARKFSEGMKQARINISRTDDYDSPRDFNGHGTHTSSTAAGSRVPGADYFGYAPGSATGMAPFSRIAMYKVIFFTGENDDYYDAAATDVLAGMDQAIEDGVDIISLSLVFFETPFFTNPIAIGAFAAIKKGIFVVCAAGNQGPHRYTILNGAPWLTSVGAGTIDRQFGAHVTLGDGDVDLLSFTGQSIYPLNLFISRVPLYYGHGNRSKETCDSLDAKDIAGKVVFCDVMPGTEIDGAIGVIATADDGEFEHPRDFNTPFLILNTKNGDLVKRFIHSAKNTTVSIKFGVTTLGTKPAPKVAYFSSRGPDLRSPWILKPDLLAPGYHILAAWVPNRGFALIGAGGNDSLLTDYALVSGTSMACPHVAGLAALLKSAHRDWSPAAIRSALMTTAYVTDNTNGIIIDMTTGVAGTPLDFGAGHVDPNKALDPGLIYDMDSADYVNYLCALNYTSQQIQIIVGSSNFTCDHGSLDLNYPSFIVILNKTDIASRTFKRALTNLVDGRSVYRAVVDAPAGMNVVVQPMTLTFDKKHSKAEFSMTVKVHVHVDTESASPQSDYFGNYGFLTWHEVNGTHVVRSPIVSASAAGKNP